jgi:hypothetical protein
MAVPGNNVRLTDSSFGATFDLQFDQTDSQPRTQSSAAEAPRSGDGMI